MLAGAWARIKIQTGKGGNIDHTDEKTESHQEPVCTLLWNLEYYREPDAYIWWKPKRPSVEYSAEVKDTKWKKNKMCFCFLSATFLPLCISPSSLLSSISPGNTALIIAELHRDNRFLESRAVAAEAVWENPSCLLQLARLPATVHAMCVLAINRFCTRWNSRLVTFKTTNWTAGCFPSKHWWMLHKILHATLFYFRKCATHGWKSLTGFNIVFLCQTAGPCHFFKILQRIVPFHLNVHSAQLFRTGCSVQCATFSSVCRIPADHQPYTPSLSDVFAALSSMTACKAAGPECTLDGCWGSVQGSWLRSWHPHPVTGPSSCPQSLRLNKQLSWIVHVYSSAFLLHLWLHHHTSFQYLH